MASLVFQYKIIMCSAVAYRTVASKSCHAEMGDSGPDSVFVLLKLFVLLLTLSSDGNQRKKEGSFCWFLAFLQ